jgi:predicted DCC family thiol-disulfide oxidoreductase YuxK
MPPSGTVVFDGDCGFCTASALRLGRMGGHRLAVVPWQRADLADLGLTATECASAVQFVGPGGRAAGADAIALALACCPPPWPALGRVLAWAPVRPVAGAAYRTVARNRHRLPGSTPACAA